MKRFPKPWFRPSRKCWYVTLDGRQINLGRRRKQAFDRYKQLLAAPRPKAAAPQALASVIDAFLEWNQKHRAADTYEWYRYRLQRFVERYDYTPYGQLFVLDADFSADADGKSDIANPVTFTSRRFDLETGIYYYRNRYYHAQAGRFLTRDPIEYDGSEWNLYEYVSSNPAATMDPTGLIT